MRTLRRLLVLGLFAAAGVGLALGVALCSAPAPAPGGDAPQAAVRDGSAAGDRPSDMPASQPQPFDGPPAQEPPSKPEAQAAPDTLVKPEAQAAPDALVKPEAQAKATGDAALVLGPGANARPTAPARTSAEAAAQIIPAPLALAQRVVPADAEPELGKLLEALEPPRAPAGPVRAPAEPIPAPEPEPPPAGAAVQVRQPAPAAAMPSPLSAPAPPAPSKSPAANISAGEGDDKLAIHIQNADIREVLELLSERGGLNILAGNAVQGKVSATLRGVDIDSALKAILRSTGFVARREGNFIYVGTPEEFEQVEQSLDRVGTRVYRPNYVTAAELQTLVQPLLTARTGVVSVSTPSEKGIGTDDKMAGGNGFAGGDVVLVRDYEAVLAQIDQVVAEVDVRPMQVAIEAMILSVKLKDDNTWGVDFQLLRNKDHVRFGWGTPLDNLASFKFDKGGLKFGFLDSSLGAFLKALEEVGDTNVIATPRLMVLNKNRAEILIGEKLGYISTTVTETSSTQSVEFLDVGAQLRLRPFISRDGLIRMEVHPELSTGAVTIVGENTTIPNKQVTQVTTNIMVRDGHTLVIGGLMRNELETTTQQVPFFGSLPLVGLAFRTTKETTQRREIIVLVTPRIVYDQQTNDEAQRAACEFHRRQAVYAEKMNPLGKRWVGRKYFRLAQSAWSRGDRDTALRFAEMAVQFDPLNRAAIDLRSNIWLGQPAGEHALDGPEAGGPTASPLDGEAIAPWLLDALEQGSKSRPAPLHPLDAGQPGGHTDITRPRVFP